MNARTEAALMKVKERIKENHENVKCITDMQPSGNVTFAFVTTEGERLATFTLNQIVKKRYPAS